MFEPVCWLEKLDAETLKRMDCATKAFEKEFGVALLIFNDEKDRSRAYEDITFARKVKNGLLALILPQQRGQ